jgi:hypothetical protein
MSKELKPKSVFINQVDGGYVINLQGNNHYPVKIAVSTEDMANAVRNFFDTAETIADESSNQVGISTLQAGQSIGNPLND